MNGAFSRVIPIWNGNHSFGGCAKPFPDCIFTTRDKGKRMPNQKADRTLEYVESESSPNIVPAGESRLGAPIKVFTDRVLIKVSSRDTAGTFAVCEILASPHEGSTLRYHSYEDQCFYVLEGHFQFEFPGGRTEAGPGTSVYIPRNVAYRYSNDAPGAGRLLIVSVPGGLDRFLAEAGRLDSAEGQPSAALQYVFDKHGVLLLDEGDSI
jgi:mannose-6-phosphate isomerase-like protein (cupin superfamily)